MAQEPATRQARNGQHTITLPITEEQYAEIINDPKRFRNEWLDPTYADCPELFPPGFENGYEMKGHYHTTRQNIDIRRIALRDGTKYQIRPAFILPGMVAFVPAKIRRAVLGSRPRFRTKCHFLVSP